MRLYQIKYFWGFSFLPAFFCGSCNFAVFDNHFERQMSSLIFNKALAKEVVRTHHPRLLMWQWVRDTSDLCCLFDLCLIW